MSNQDNRSASQKIKDLENAVMSLYQTCDNMARDLMTIKEAIKLLGNKADSIVKASSIGGPINDEVIGRIMVENNVEELRQKVKVMVAQGVLAPSVQVSAASFVVGQEQSDDGGVVNPRLQFMLQALQPELQTKFIGALVGDVLNLQEGKLKFKVSEIYDIQQQKAPEAVEAPSEAPAAAEASPAPTEAAVAPSEPTAQPDQSVTPQA